METLTSVQAENHGYHGMRKKDEGAGQSQLPMGLLAQPRDPPQQRRSNAMLLIGVEKGRNNKACVGGLNNGG